MRRIAILLALAVVIAAAVLLHRADDGDVIKRMWYLDLNTRTLFAGPYAAVAPIPAPSGGYSGPDAGELGFEAGVVAMVVRPQGGGEPRIAYLQRYTREGHERRRRLLDGQAPDPADDGGPQGDQLIAFPPTDAEPTVGWHSPGSAPGKAILAQYAQLLRSGGMELYLPGD